MQIFDVKVHLSNKKNGSYLELPKEIVDQFTKNGQENLFLVYLPFRHSSVLKNLGITKEECAQNFEKSGLACSLLTMSQYYTLMYITVPKICNNDTLKKEEFRRYFGSRTAENNNNRFMISDYQKCGFLGGNFKLIVNPNSNSSLAEIMEDCNIKKLAKLLKTKREKTQNLPTKVAKKSPKKLISKLENDTAPKTKSSALARKTPATTKDMPRNQRIKYNAKYPDETVKK